LQSAGLFGCDNAVRCLIFNEGFNQRREEGARKTASEKVSQNRACMENLTNFWSSGSSFGAKKINKFNVLFQRSISMKNINHFDI